MESKLPPPGEVPPQAGIGVHFQRAQPGFTVFAAYGSAAAENGQPTKGRPFYGQAKGQLRLTWRSYAGPPQHKSHRREAAIPHPLNPLNPHAGGVSNGDTTTLSGQRPLSNFRTLAPIGRINLKNLFITTFGAKPRPSSSLNLPPLSHCLTFPLAHQPTISLFTLLYHSAIIRITT